MKNWCYIQSKRTLTGSKITVNMCTMLGHCDCGDYNCCKKI